jgi:hypothetical protein
MTGRKILHLVLGCLALALGAWIAVMALRSLVYLGRAGIFDGWTVAEVLLRFSGAAYFIWIGSRAIRRVGQEVPATKIGWGRLLLGVVFIYLQIKDLAVPSSRRFQPDNADEAFGMRIAGAIFLIAGVGLIFWAFRKKKSKPLHGPAAAASTESRF